MPERPLHTPRAPRHHRAIPVQTIPHAEPLDADAWARQYVAALLALDGWRVPADEIREAS